MIADVAYYVGNTFTDNPSTMTSGKIIKICPFTLQQHPKTHKKIPNGGPARSRRGRGADPMEGKGKEEKKYKGYLTVGSHRITKQVGPSQSATSPSKTVEALFGLI